MVFWYRNTHPDHVQLTQEQGSLQCVRAGFMGVFLLTDSKQRSFSFFSMTRSTADITSLIVLTSAVAVIRCQSVTRGARTGVASQVILADVRARPAQVALIYV